MIKIFLMSLLKISIVFTFFLFIYIILSMVKYIFIDNNQSDNKINEYKDQEEDIVVIMTAIKYFCPEDIGNKQIIIRKLGRLKHEEIYSTDK